jgi:hypothetical protein
VGFTGCVDFLFAIILFVCDGDERLDDNNDLSLLDVDERMDEDLVTRDVIMGGAVLGSNDVFKDNDDDEDDEGGDGESFPILEHV